ncbi:MAG: archaeal proteasome endopeptidase complex subunit beta [Desulfurococcales archaeon]|nr:archaeal proteasome endopeptidase complex subunit beta [Desulfurococcales archaeon]MCE4605419.1 archaeal proteasome endopeptidase complex subunit beta [Desulfurococcales archaeon]
MSWGFGATVLGLKAGDGVVLATDRRLSYGGFVMSRNARKIFVLEDRVGIAIAGLYGDTSGLSRILEAEIKYYELTSGSSLSVKGVAKRLSSILYAYKFYPFFVEAIIGGIDDGEPRLYVLDSLGSITEEDYAASGSGATMALGVLEATYKPGLSIDEAMDIAVKAMKSAIERDAMSGDGIDIVAVTRSGVRERKITLKMVEG